jgi:small subunit ribosomal protein S2
MRREQIKLDKTLGGIREMSRTPSAVWIVDTNKEHLAVEEARKLMIPNIEILDSNCDPDLVDYPIPGNDDAIRAVGLLTRVIADAVADGLIARSGAKDGGETAKGIGSDEPLADWERDLLQGEADKAAVAATGGDTKSEDTPATEATGASVEGAAAKQAADAPKAEEPAKPDEAAATPQADESPEPPKSEETAVAPPPVEDAPKAEDEPEAPKAEDAPEAPKADDTETPAADDAAPTKES